MGLLLGLSIVLLFGYLLAQQLPYIRENVRPSFTAIIMLSGFALLVFLLRAFMNRVIFSPLGVNIPLLHWMAIVVAGSLANTLPFAAGTVAKGFYLKRIHDLPYRIFAGGQIALFALVLCINGFVGLFLLATVFRSQASVVAWGLFALMACAGFVLVLPKTLQRFLGKERFPWPEWSNQQRRVAWMGAGLSQIGILLLLAAKLYLCFAMGLEEVSFAACLLFSASGAITRLISVTPASIGVREFLIASIAHLLGFQFSDALIASTIDRIIDLIIIAGLVPLFGYYLKKNHKPESRNTQNDQELSP